MFSKSFLITLVLLALCASPAQAWDEGPAPTTHTESVELQRPTPPAPPTPAQPVAPAVQAVKVTPEEYIPYQTGDRDVTTTPTARALWQLAVQYWNAEPICPTGYHVLVNNITDQPAHVDGTEESAAGEAQVPGCFMRIIPSYWMETLTPSEEAADLCVVFIHEFGHSLGNPHTTNIYSVMDPLTAYTTGMPSECKNLEATPEAIVSKTKAKSKSHSRKKHRKVKKVKIKHHGSIDFMAGAPTLLDQFVPFVLS